MQHLRSSPDGLMTKLRSTVSELKDTAQKHQRDLSGSMEPAIQSQMTPSYQQVTAEAGTGSHRRRVAKLEAAIEKEAPKMFRAATDGVVGKMQDLSGSIGRTLERDVIQAAHSALKMSYCPLWDDLNDASLQARRKLAPRCAEVLLESKNAVRRLVENGNKNSAPSSSAAVTSGASGAGAEDDDDDLVDVTEANRQAKRARQQEEAIELDDSPEPPMPENAAPQGAGAASLAHGVKVKSEA